MTKTARDTKNKVESVDQRWVRFQDLYRGFEKKLVGFEEAQVRLRQDFQDMITNSNKGLLVKLNKTNE